MDELAEIQRTLGHLEGKVTGLCTDTRKLMVVLTGNDGVGLKTRVDRLEQRGRLVRWLFGPVLAVAITLGAQRVFATLFP